MDMTENALKYEGFSVGDKIRSFDKNPAESDQAHYIVGIITRIIYSGQHKSYKVLVLEDRPRIKDKPTRVGSEVMVAMQMTYNEFENRVTKVG